MGLVPQVRLFNKPRYQKVREKWCAGMFGMGYMKFIRPCHVAVNDTEDRADADFFMRSDGREYAFQLVEAIEPKRRRGDEYKARASDRLHSLPYEPEKGHVEGPTWIASRIEQKAAKNYAGAAHLNLLVYANFAARGLQHRSVVDAAAKFQAAFASIWVLTSLHLASLFVANDLGRLDDWSEIQTVEEYDRLVRKRRD